MSNDNNKKITPPNRFVGLHAHSTYSIGDGLGTPEEHIDFAIENNADALALTDHGNMNGIARQFLHHKKLSDKGVSFKAIPGVEAYFHPSLEDWKKLYNTEQERKEEEKIEKKREAFKKKMKKNIGDAIASTKEDLAEVRFIEDAAREVDEETKGDSGVENEDDSKRNRWKNPLFQRNHLVLLPKNNEGLKTLFKCISLSFKDGFYRYPRMDFDMLRKYSKGNIIGLSACISGEALCLTNVGLISLKEIVNRIKNKEEISVLSYCEKTQKEIFSKIVWGELTRKNAKILKITLENGKTIKCTADHKFYTNHGWLRADQLNNYDDTSILNSK